MSKWKELFISRRFWAGVFGTLVLFAGSIFPGFPDISENIAGVIVPIVAYIVGTSIDPAADPAGKLLAVLKSRKFWAMLAPVVVAVVRSAVPDFPVTDEQMIAFVIMISGYIIGTGVGDYVKLRG